MKSVENDKSVRAHRKKTGAVAYRFGFNGKENDNEAKGGEGLQQDYGMRVYDNRLGRFLSVDPLTIKYPKLTPYQFAANSPISGIDLDGLEYLNAGTSRIEIVRGLVKLKIANMHNVTKYRFEELNEDPKNWATGEIGINTTVGNLGLQGLPMNPVQTEELGEDPTHTPEKIDIQNPIGKSTNIPDRRYKQLSVESASPVAVNRLGRASAVLDAVIIVGTAVQSYLVNEDMELAGQHAKLAANAVFDVNTALKEGKIPNQYQNMESLSDLANVVLTGESYLNKVGVVKDKGLVALGKKIYYEVSKRRFKYDGTAITVRGGNGQVIRQIPIPNPIYDPTYGQAESSAPATTEEKPR